jgi:hypothetical protein
VKKPHSDWRDVVVDARDVLGRDATTAMARKGVVIHESEAWRKFVKSSIDHYEKEQKVEVRYDQFGWKDGDNSFLVGKTLYTPTQVTQVSGNPTLEQRAQYLRLSQAKGASLERWQHAANKLFQEGLEHQSLALLCGFAAPLMRFHSEGEGGSILCLQSDKTSSGKTTALEAAASVWGHFKGTKLDETDTRVAKGLKLGLLGNLPCTFDELHERDPELIRQFVITFTNGSDKDRGTSDGGLRVNKADWQTILIVASNTSIADKLSNHEASDAPAARILELATSLPDHMSPHDFDHIRRELAQNSGFAGDAFMRRLIQPELVNWVRDNIPQWTKSVRNAAGLSDRHRFWTRMIVSVIAAGTIVEQYKICDFSMKRMTDWLIKTAASQRDVIQGGNTLDAASVLSLFMDAHKNNTLSVAKAQKGPTRVAVNFMPSGPLYCRYEVEDKRLSVTETILKRWLVKQSVSINNFLQTLKGQGVLLGEVRKVTLGAGTDIASGQTPCFVINMASPLVSGIVASIEESHPAHIPPNRAERIAQWS